MQDMDCFHVVWVYDCMPHTVPEVQKMIVVA